MDFLLEEKAANSQVACLNRIYRKINAEGFSEDSIRELRDDIDYVSKTYDIDNVSAVLLAAVLEKSPARNITNNEELALYLGCSNIEFIRYHENLRKLDKAGIIQTAAGRGSHIGYRVTSETLKAVESNTAFKPVKMSGLTAEELFSRFRKYFRSFMNDSIDADRLLEELDSIVSYNDHLVFCRKALDSALYSDCTETERRMFFYLCHRYVTHGNKAVGIEILTKFTGIFEDDECIKRYLAREAMPIQHSGLVCFAIENGFVDSNALSISEQVREEFFVGIDPAQEEPVNCRDLITAGNITAKELFFNETERVQVARLENLLEGEHFKEVQKRLVSTGMRKGFNAIFYGAPGTGKTASVFELARRSGRDIFKVDMTKLKSKWVGESEKSVRAVFKLYRSMCNTSDKVPILLFNEADAIFNRRIENVEDSVDQMNNAIQNIILEEMETIEGILIATTNLLSNLDPAFERRFIFKVEFKMPEKEPRARIWKSMIPALSQEDADTLANKYAFSGGNIENIARKCTVEYVLSGNEPTLSSLDNYCQEEILSRKNKHNKIGF